MEVSKLPTSLASGEMLLRHVQVTSESPQQDGSSLHIVSTQCQLTHQHPLCLPFLFSTQDLLWWLLWFGYGFHSKGTSAAKLVPSTTVLKGSWIFKRQDLVGGDLVMVAFVNESMLVSCTVGSHRSGLAPPRADCKNSEPGYSLVSCFPSHHMISVDTSSFLFYFTTML